MVAAASASATPISRHPGDGVHGRRTRGARMLGDGMTQPDSQAIPATPCAGCLGGADRVAERSGVRADGEHGHDGGVLQRARRVRSEVAAPGAGRQGNAHGRPAVGTPRRRRRRFPAGHAPQRRNQVEQCTHARIVPDRAGSPGTRSTICGKRGAGGHRPGDRPPRGPVFVVDRAVAPVAWPRRPARAVAPEGWSRCRKDSRCSWRTCPGARPRTGGVMIDPAIDFFAGATTSRSSAGSWSRPSPGKPRDLVLLAWLRPASTATVSRSAARCRIPGASQAWRLVARGPWQEPWYAQRTVVHI